MLHAISAFVATTWPGGNLTALKAEIRAEFGRAMFVQNKNNVRRLADLVVVELALTDGEVLVVAQADVEALLSAELIRRFGNMSHRLHLAHHGNITGMNQWGHVTRMVVIGRPAVNRLAGERLAELVRGSSVAVMTDGDAARWPTVAAGIRMADGTGRSVVIQGDAFDALAMVALLPLTSTVYAPSPHPDAA